MSISSWLIKEVLIPFKMGQSPAPALAKTVVFFPPFLRQGHCSSVLGGTGADGTHQLLLPATVGAMNLPRCH